MSKFHFRHLRQMKTTAGVNEKKNSFYLFTKTPLVKRINILVCCILISWTATPLQAAESNAEWGALDIHGFISQGFLKSWENNFYAGTKDGTFQFNEFGLNFATDLTDRLRAGIQLFSRDLGDLNNNTVEVDWAYADYRWRDWLGLRFGRVKTPFGLYNEVRDLDMLRTGVFLPQSVYYETMRDTFIAKQGISLYGYLPLTSLGSLNYQMQYGEMNIETDSSMEKYMEDQARSDLVDVDASRVWVGSLEWDTPLEGLRFGSSLMLFDLKLGYRITEQTPWRAEEIPVGMLFSFEMNDNQIISLSAEYIQEQLMLNVEYESSRSKIVSFFVEEEQREEGYYANIAYRLNDWWELGAYYAVYYFDTHDKEGKRFEEEGQAPHRAWQKEFVLTSRFDINAQWTLKLEGHFTNGTALMLYQDNPDGLEEDSYLFAVKTTFNF